MNPDGLLLCSKYAASPNMLGYCGPDESPNLIGHVSEKNGDKDVEVILSQFETLYPYLKLISSENKIRDPFSLKVVEAYWIGNSLLNYISRRNYVYLLQEKLDLEKKMTKIQFQKIRSKVLSARFYPHHAFHVFNIFKRTGVINTLHTIETMDQCRISFGKIIMKKGRDKIIVKYEPLTKQNGVLDFGTITQKELFLNYKGKNFVGQLNDGDWVSFHWGFVCDILTSMQAKNLQFYTRKAVEFFNS